MALTIPQTALPDPPTYDEFVLGANLIGGYFQITTNPAEVEILYGRYGGEERLPAVVLPIGSYSVGRSPSGRPLAGIRARNATAGLGATLGGYFWTESDPTIAFVGVPSSQVAGAVVIPVVALADWPPASPVDGQTVWLELPATFSPIGGVAVRWLCTFHETGGFWSVTGQPLVARVLTSQGTASGAYVDLATVGPSITIPLDGDYNIAAGFGQSGTFGNSEGLMSYAIGGAGAVDANATAAPSDTSSVAGVTVRLERRILHTGLAASTVVLAKYRALNSSTVNFYERYLWVEPHRLT